MKAIKAILFLFSVLFQLGGLSSCSSEPTGDLPTSQANEAYSEKLLATKKAYPFERWKEYFRNGPFQYNEANCDIVKHIFDELIENLIAVGPDATEQQKIALFKIAIEKTNIYQYQLIETSEREDLCALTNQITIACGLVPEKYGHGEGLASEWREW